MADRKLKLRNIAEELNAMYSPFYVEIWQWESCVQSRCRVCSQSIKNNNASTIQNVVCNCFNATKRTFYVNIWQWMKHGSTTSLWSPIGNQPSGQQQVKAVQSNQRRKHQQARFWPSYFGMARYFVHRFPWERKIHQKRILYSIMRAFEGRNHNPPKKNGFEWRRKKYSFTKIMHCVTSQSQQYYMNCTSNCFRIHPILKIWPPVTTSYLQTPKECSRERDLATLKKWYRKLWYILWPKTNRLTKKGIELLEKRWNQCITQEGDYVDE